MAEADTLNRRRVRLADLTISGAAAVDHGANSAQVDGASGWIVIKGDGTPVEGATRATVACGHDGCALRRFVNAAACPAGHRHTSKGDDVPDNKPAEGSPQGESSATPADALAKALASVPAEVAKAVEAAMSEKDAAVAKAAAQAEEAIKVAARLADERELERWVAKAAEMVALPAEAGTFGAVLKACAAALDDDAMAELERVLKAADAQLRTSVLASSSGRSGDPEAAPTEGMAALVAKRDALMAADPSLTPEQAMTKAALANPDLAMKAR